MKIKVKEQEWEVLSSPGSDEIKKLLENGATFGWVTKDTTTSVAYDTETKKVFVACPLDIAEKNKDSLIFAMVRQLEHA